MIKNLEANHLYIVQVAGATKSIFEKNPQYIFGKYSEPKTISLKGMVVTKYTFDCCYSYCAFGGENTFTVWSTGADMCWEWTSVVSKTVCHAYCQTSRVSMFAMKSFVHNLPVVWLMSRGSGIEFWSLD